jgi:hypothetical protein
MGWSRGPAGSSEAANKSDECQTNGGIVQCRRNGALRCSGWQGLAGNSASVGLDGDDGLDAAVT